MTKQPSPDDPDFGVLLALAFRAYVDELHRELAARGFHGIRPSFGVVLRALHERPLTLTQLAEGLAVTKQAAAKVVSSMRSLGLVDQRPMPRDGRARELALTDRGRAVVAAAVEVGGGVEARLAARLGPAAAAGMRAALVELVLAAGGEQELRGRRPRALW